MAGVTKSAAKAARRSQRSAFLVDDEPALLDLAEAALQDQGFTFKKFSAPDEALASFRKARRKPDLLVTDYALGRMNGLELITRCRALHPGLKVVMVSGHAGVEIAMDTPGQVDRFLAKPYQPETLAKLVRGLFEDGAA